MTDHEWRNIFKRMMKIIKVKLAQFGIDERIEKKEIAVGFRAPEPEIYTLADALKDGALRTRNVRETGVFEEVYCDAPQAHYDVNSHYNNYETGYNTWIRYITSKKAADDWAEDRRHRLELEVEAQREYNRARLEEQAIIRSCTTENSNPVYGNEEYNQYLE